MTKKYIPPDGYTFLLAAGEIDSCTRRQRRVNVRRCGEELLRISRMNGSYEKLPDEFRTDMREIVSSSTDNETAQKLGELGQKLLNLDSLDESGKSEVRGHCSTLSRYWPMRPHVLMVS